MDSVNMDSVNMDNRKILVTAALPYANGDIHLGHLVEYLQTDFWVRFQKMRGHECRFFCASDSHGTPIMVSARDKGISPEELISEAQKRHEKDLQDFGVEFDHFSTTDSEVNKKLVMDFYEKMKSGGHLEVRSVAQAYCEHDKMFLPDRFVRGVCPKCGAENQYGDSCDTCGATYSPLDMKDPSCFLCGNKPIEKASEHVFFKLESFREFLKSWVPHHTEKVVYNKLQEWLQEELRDWDISRDAPYFGFSIPGFKDKYFYVWLDAPVGYMATSYEWAQKNQRDFMEFWGKEAQSEIYHFIGKDIVYFHTLFWPAMLKSAGYKPPNHVFVHGYLTVNGVKMSKSKGTFIMGRTFLDHADPVYLRYYYGTKLNAGLSDVDLNFDDFCGRVNSELVGKISNLASRAAQMMHKRLDGRLGKMSPKGRELWQKAVAQGDQIAQHYEDRNFGKATNQVRDLFDEVNRYFDEVAPWKLVKEDPETTRSILTDALNLFRVLTIYLKPIIPDYVKKVEELFSEPPYSWSCSQNLIEEKPINPFEHLATRLDRKTLDEVVEKGKSAEKGKSEKGNS